MRRPRRHRPYPPFRPPRRAAEPSIATNRRIDGNLLAWSCIHVYMCKRRMRTVLIIDDNPAVGEALSLALSLHEIRPLTALTPEQGLAMLETERVDVVIQDMNFTADTTSGEEGIALFRDIRQRHTDLPV